MFNFKKILTYLMFKTAKLIFSALVQRDIGSSCIPKFTIIK